MQRLRPESSVALCFNDLDEIEFPCERSGPVIHLTPPAQGAVGGALDMHRKKPIKKTPFNDLAPERRRGLIYDPPPKHNL